MLSLTSLALAASLAASAAAHATFQAMWINGVDYGSACVRLPLSNSPVTDVTSADIACNVNATPSTNVCPVVRACPAHFSSYQRSGS